jgi:hypothetical protein
VKIDAFVCRPSVLINDERTAACLIFQTMDSQTWRITGSECRIAMAIADAMLLLGILDFNSREVRVPATKVGTGIHARAIETLPQLARRASSDNMRSRSLGVGDSCTARSMMRVAMTCRPFSSPANIFRATQA